MKQPARFANLPAALRLSAISALAAVIAAIGWSQPEERLGRGDRFAIMARFFAGDAAMTGETSYRLNIEADQPAVQTIFPWAKEPSSTIVRLKTEDLDEILDAVREAEFFKLKKVYGKAFGFGFVLRVHLAGKTHAVDFDPINMRPEDKADLERFMRVWKVIEAKVPPPRRDGERLQAE
ncbi:hypothetical protein [Paludisphaera soli]|uniref:hypothetical protein n=1 Tax=Paludisphaera soli TaxID=2712865 RepID=UPI0013EDF4CA|nr:hypothetical protein [Paludisphaera soli]